jgi:hypothetical protein
VIPTSYIQEWTAATPWPDSRQVEQDLIISRALCDIFNEPLLADRLAFRGGTALNKLLFRQTTQQRLAATTWQNSNPGLQRDRGVPAPADPWIDRPLRTRTPARWRPKGKRMRHTADR